MIPLGQMIRELARALTPAPAPEPTCVRCGAAPARWPCVCEPTWCEACYEVVLREGS